MQRKHHVKCGKILKNKKTLRDGRVFIVNYLVRYLDLAVPEVEQRFQVNPEAKGVLISL